MNSASRRLALFGAALVFWPSIAGALNSTKVVAPEYGSGLKLVISFQPLPGHKGTYAVIRSDQGPDGPWEMVKKELKPKKRQEAAKNVPTRWIHFEDKVVDTPRTKTPQDQYWYQVLAIPERFTPPKRPQAETSTKERQFAQRIVQAFRASAVTSGPIVSGHPKAFIFKNYPGIWLLLILVGGVCAMMFLFTRQVRRGKEIKIRRIPGIDAIEEGIGRATEMGKPVLYVPGIDSLEDIQTIASMLILGEVSKTIAEYQTDVIVSCCVPIVREVADEVVRSGYYRAGHPDAFDPTSVRFIAADQFAFCAGTNGIMYRQKTGNKHLLGSFFCRVSHPGRDGLCQSGDTDRGHSGGYATAIFYCGLRLHTHRRRAIRSFGISKQ